MAELPTADDFFGKQSLPTADQFFGAPPPAAGKMTDPLSGQDMDDLFSSGSPGAILNAFGQGIKQGWGTEPLGFSAEQGKQLRELGIFNDYQNNRTSLAKQFNEAILRPSAVALDLALRRLPGVVHGIGMTVPGLGPIAAGMEAFPAGHFTGFPVRVPVLDRAADLGVIGKGEAGYLDREAVSALTPNREAIARPVTQEPAGPTDLRGGGAAVGGEFVAPITGDATMPPAPDIHAVARTLAPDTFAEYDALAARKDTFRRWLDELGAARAESEPAKTLQGRIDGILDRVGGVEDRLTKAAAGRLQAARTELDTLLRTDTSDMARVRRDLLDTDFRMRDLAPDVSAAYRRAADEMPPAEVAPAEPAVPPVAAPEAAPEATPAAIPEAVAPRFRVAARDPDTGQIYIGKPGQIHADLVENPAHAEMGFADAAGNFLTREEAFAALKPEAQRGLKVQGELDAADYELNAKLPVEPARPPVVEPRAAETPPPAQPLEGGIAGDVSRQLVRAGRPAEEADAAGALVQSHYEARAERFGGILGTAEDLYRSDAPNVRAGRGVAPALELAQRQGELEQVKRGSIRLATDDAKATVTLFRDADASTFIHETGHQWLEELTKDAAHPQAPADLLADNAAVRKWLDVEDGAEIPRRAHEKFARGFERYMMEGHAPNEALAGVFAKFRDWLTKIYETVTRLRAPINDEIRGVFGRLIAIRGERAVVAPERGAPVTAPEFVTTAPATRGRGVYETVPREPRRLIDFLRREGGLRDEGGESSHTIGGKNQRPGLINSKGKSLDDAALRAWEEGYFPDHGANRPTINDLLDAIREDASGMPRYSFHDRAMAEAYHAALARNAEVDRLAATLGVDARNMNREEFFDLAAEQLSLEERARELGAMEAEAERSFAEAEARAKEFIESRGDAWEPDALYDTAGEPRSLEELENAYKSETAALRNPPEGGGGTVPSGPTGPGEGVVQGGVRQSGRGAGPTGRGGSATGEAPRGAHESFGPADDGLIDKAGNIRIENLNVPEEVAQVIREAADQNGGFMTARRGVISDGEVLSLADALGMDPRSLNTRQIGEAFNAEQIIAARKLLIQSATEVRDAMAKAATGDDAAVIAYGTAKARHMMIQEQVSGITAEAGRALRAFRSLEGSKDATELAQFLQQQTGRTLNQMRREAQLGMKLDTPQKVSKFVHDTEKPTWKDYLIEAWINALLSGPLTHIKNVVGNTAIAVNSIIETGGAAAVGAARQMLPGAAAERVMFGEAEARLFGLVQGAQDGLIAAGKALADENVISSGPHTIEQRRFQAIPSVKVNVAGIDMELGGKQIRLPGRFLTAEDELFKGIAFRQEMNALAYRQASSEGLVADARAQRIAQLMEYPDEAMIAEARKHALYQTFQNPLGRAGLAIQMFSNSHMLAKLVIPFVRTPINILKYANERTLFGLLSREVRDNLAGRNGAVARDTQIARMALGSMVATTAIGLAAQGLVTGGGPSDPKEKAALRLTGWQPYSIKLGDMYYSYGWLDPLGTIVGTAADIVEVTKAGIAKEAEADKVAAMFVGSLSKNIMSKASLRGASDLVQTLTDPDRYGPKYLQNFAGSLVPSVLGQIARADDPVLRETRTTLDAIKSRIPGMRGSLLPKRDIWGEPIANEGALGPDMLSPVAQHFANSDPVNRALVNLPYSPTMPERKIRGVELTPQQYDDYARIAGRFAKMQLDAIVTPQFRQFPPEVQISIMQSTISHAREAAAAQVMMQSLGGENDIIQKATDAKAAGLHGASPAEVKTKLRAR